MNGRVASEVDIINAMEPVPIAEAQSVFARFRVQRYELFSKVLFFTPPFLYKNPKLGGLFPISYFLRNLQHLVGLQVLDDELVGAHEVFLLAASRGFIYPSY